jgi:spermidine/putrescine transport system permease protein
MSTTNAFDAVGAAHAFDEQSASPSRPPRRLPWRNPWRRPWFLAGITWAYVLWSLVPVLVAVQFSFNAGRSRSSWQGFSFRWYWQDPDASLWQSPQLLLALRNTLVLGVLTVLIATPIGVLLALGLTRWRSKASAVSNGISLVPLVTPEIVLGSALYLVFSNLYTSIPLGLPAMLLGHVTFSISYILVIVRSRLLSIGNEYEIAARDLGATSTQALWTILMPMLMPAIFASAMITFAGSLDDFVVSSFLFGDASNITVPIALYSAVKASPTPALNALAALLLFGSMLALVLAYLVLRGRRKGGGEQALNTLASFE